MASSVDLDKAFFDLLVQLATNGVNHAVEGLSDMVGDTFTVSSPVVKWVPALQIPNALGGPETEAIGIYLKAEGDMAGQFMLILPYLKGLELVDALMCDPVGTATELDAIGRSALAEVGNLTGAYFLNAIAQVTGKSTVLTPPAVMADMVGAILNIIAASAAETLEYVITITTIITRGDQDVNADFWYIPDSTTIEAIRQELARKMQG